MATFTTRAQYKKGVVKSLARPLFDDPDEVVVTFVKFDAPEEADPDEALFREIEPRYRRIRRKVFKEKYPELYQKYYGATAKSNS
ncbi:hypothetical protein A3J43_03185 [Candidatus Uhrbacteria bacterium RIFCSPHIGHO2_12_FULL_54_23]|uniref:Uncharacterized protein n=2 Tax=Candidatus Uhriibacteriota TaxID=1752732 RepID=A0A1F7UK76_9BACT|nr:MAG: hypothetical protein A3J43_03185 [Candidatus Uhrbacteria bacterium RIFCSPHIGHO2_12_FULL_54_23]OGL90709.1 MAG: hypothetical protein A3J36_02540 [Candidatus Uhrbacteria bacterium RIFCSPLOWO2_02_FULL_54_37]